MTEKELLECLQKLPYSCYLVVYGPERDYRTKYRSEHHGVFRSGMVNNAQEALDMIKNSNYPGHYSEMTVISIGINASELVVEEIV